MGWAWPRSLHHWDERGDSAASVSADDSFGQGQAETRKLRVVTEPRTVAWGAQWTKAFQS